MRIANVTLHIGHGDVVVRGVTPAECQILVHQDPKIGHTNRKKGFPLAKLDIVGDAMGIEFDGLTNTWTSTKVLRTDKEEYQRLYRKFGRKKVETVYPASSATLPATFDKVDGWEDDKDIATVKNNGAKPVEIKK